MQASVYHLVITDRDDGLPHPHVVVLLFSGNRDCIVVPAYSAGGYKIEEQIRNDRKKGLADDQIFVQLDNATNIDFVGSFPGKEAIWCVTLMRRLSQKSVANGKHLGQMKLPAFRRVAQTLLRWAEGGESDLSANAIKQLRNLIKNLPE